MNLKPFPLLLFGSALLMSGGLSLLADGFSPKPGPAILATAMPGAYSFSALMQDLGPEGIYVDVQGHDNNDDVVGNVTYNNQTKDNVHIESIYVHGKNIKTQGMFRVNITVQIGAKIKLLEVLRDKLGEPATVAVEVHYQ
jgi:hypothetical protein